MPPPDLAAAIRAKAMDTLSTVGAGVAGIGLGALLAEALQVTAPALLVVGLAAHLVSMMGRRRLDVVRPAAWWETVLYWGCWALIAALGAWLVWRWIG